jgi:hypothetical protein
MANGAQVMKYSSCDNRVDFIKCVGAFVASQKLPKLGGRFVYYDISETGWKSCTDGIQTIGGWVDQDTDSMPAGTYATGATSTTALATKFPITDVEHRIFELPYATSGAAATLTEAVGATLIDHACGLYVSSASIQYADPTKSAVFVIKGYDVSRNTLKVEVLLADIVQVA